MPMSNDGFIELGAYYATIFTDQTPAGWWSWVFFERRSDFGEGRALISGVRHRVPGDHESQAVAVDAAYAYATSCVEAGDTGV